jgi:stearoyl-CoA desaturase (delta-9 desaturase)
MHHSDPACARHGADPWQIDISAAVIRIFERLGWATSVHWPAAARLDSHRRGQDQPPVLQPASQAVTSEVPIIA